MIGPKGMNLSSSALTNLAEREMRKGMTEDAKGARESAKAAFARQVDAQKNAIAKQREEAAKRHEAAEKQSGAGFWGSLIGIVTSVAAIAVGIVFAASGNFVLGAALIGLGGGLLAGVPAAANELVKGGVNELNGAADTFADQARSYQLDVTREEKDHREAESRANEINQRYLQALRDARAINEKN